MYIETEYLSDVFYKYSKIIFTNISNPKLMVVLTFWSGMFITLEVVPKVYDKNLPAFSFLCPARNYFDHPTTEQIKRLDDKVMLVSYLFV